MPRLENPGATLGRLAPTLIPAIAVSTFAVLASPVHGLIFGVYMFGTLLPATAVDAALPLNGMRLGEARGTP